MLRTRLQAAKTTDREPFQGAPFQGAIAAGEAALNAVSTVSTRMSAVKPTNDIPYTLSTATLDKVRRQVQDAIIGLAGAADLLE